MIPLLVFENPISRMLIRLWNGQYSLAKAFWGFFILGSIPLLLLAAFAGMIFIEAPIAHDIVVLSIYGSYRIIALVGVWRSANNYRQRFRKAELGTGGLLAFCAKTVCILWICGDVSRFTGITFHYLITHLAN